MHLIYHVVILEIYAHLYLSLFIYLINLDINPECSKNIGLHIYIFIFLCTRSIKPKIAVPFIRERF